MQPAGTTSVVVVEAGVLVEAVVEVAVVGSAMDVVVVVVVTVVTAVDRVVAPVVGTAGARPTHVPLTMPWPGRR